MVERAVSDLNLIQVGVPIGWRGDVMVGLGHSDGGGTRIHRTRGRYMRRGILAHKIGSMGHLFPLIDRISDKYLLNRGGFCNMERCLICMITNRGVCRGALQKIFDQILIPV